MNARKRILRLAVLAVWEYWAWTAMGATGLWAGFILFGIVTWIFYVAIDAAHDLSRWAKPTKNETTNYNLTVEQGSAIKGTPEGPTREEWAGIVEVGRHERKQLGKGGGK
jgi:hypothetical protein